MRRATKPAHALRTGRSAENTRSSIRRTIARVGQAAGAGAGFKVRESESGEVCASTIGSFNGQDKSAIFDNHVAARKRLAGLPFGLERSRRRYAANDHEVT